MSWKDWPYWLKGGNITFLFFILIIFVFPKFLLIIFGPNVKGTIGGSVFQVFEPTLSFIVNMDFLALPFCGGFCVGERG